MKEAEKASLEERFGAVEIGPRSEGACTARVTVPRAWAYYPGVYGGGNPPPARPWVHANGRNRGEAYEQLERCVGSIAINHLSQEVPLELKGRHVMVQTVRFEGPFEGDVALPMARFWEALDGHPEIAAGTLIEWMVQYPTGSPRPEDTCVYLHGPDGQVAERWEHNMPNGHLQPLTAVLPVVRARCGGWDLSLSFDGELLPEWVSFGFEVVANPPRARRVRAGATT